MSGVVIMRALLAADPDVAALVPAARIYTGGLPQGWVAPAIGVTSAGGSDFSTVARLGAHSMMRERVQVTVYAKTFIEQERILKACKLGQGVYTGIIGTTYVNSVLPLGVNPGIPPAGDDIYERSRDFMVTFREAN